MHLIFNKFDNITSYPFSNKTIWNSNNKLLINKQIIGQINNSECLNNEKLKIK